MPFLGCGGEGQVSAGIPNLYQALKNAGVPNELRIYAGVGHGFGVRASNPPRVAGWIERFRDWMSDRGLLRKERSAVGSQGKQAVKITRWSGHRFRSNEARLWLSVIACNLGNLWRRLFGSMVRRIAALPVPAG